MFVGLLKRSNRASLSCEVANGIYVMFDRACDLTPLCKTRVALTAAAVWRVCADELSELQPLIERHTENL